MRKRKERGEEGVEFVRSLLVKAKLPSTGFWLTLVSRFRIPRSVQRGWLLEIQEMKSKNTSFILIFHRNANIYSKLYLICVV